MVVFGLAVVPVLGLLLVPVFTSPVGAVTDLAQKCNSDTIDKAVVFGAEVAEITAGVVKDWEGISGNDVCNITIAITHRGAGDLVINFYALPLSGWNGIFQGISGGGYRAGEFDQGASQTSLGYSVGSTDAGHSDLASSKDASSWALASPGNVNQYLLLNFARRSVHDMTLIGKALSESFYERPVERSYWTGCSTGGRQGLNLAQHFPDDYDGILANAPTIQ
ncbi:putative feruloyl esterase b [Diaporthe ampelina]|uniref:Carboxylic ester hydrolase n=1 Tax=Diaporthe ampelina TaxID=1214573 RepID=A0A0G2FU11_9PEZI|nr:putative feruloyl esterase b [Diaporthe ampelina]